MDGLKWALLAEVSGRLQADFIKSHLEAEGILTELFQESVGYIALRPPKGGSDSASRAMTGVSPIYVVGEANVKGAWRAALWTIP